MNEYTQAALEIVKAQATTRSMTQEEIVSMVSTLAKGFQAIEVGQLVAGSTEDQAPTIDSKKAIKESSITCLECGKSFKVITKKHLASHGLTPEAYRAKYGYKKGTGLACKSLARDRRKKMNDMKLWERKGAKKAD
ncbi:transcriptional regulator [Desulfovibrio aerotolerans]|uniref:Transcriptional regulator n=1 Tax=Solidesulfovibrio aerotolerans TaxID=295255 RepID=A0A7C9MH60_9BACT|nr:MucR family transcriptional regulator [Solidesulfovibrio aerotolerans]MYL84790.1 transcriptional regulator [Solidesulfovibrio aerotolerans]